jgi:(p)ppGpp synthase/HD superfamily hydrolase
MYYSNKVINAMQLAISAHEATNHKYGDKYPYTLHLAHVVDAAHRFGKECGLTEDDMATAISACWLHDAIEDARLTYNDVLNATDEHVAEIVRAVSSYTRGRNRKERMPDYIYDEIKNVPLAAFVKFCDRVANMEYSSQSGSSMFLKYRKELPDFVSKLYNPSFKVIAAHLFDLVDQYEKNSIKNN